MEEGVGGWSKPPPPPLGVLLLDMFQFEEAGERGKKGKKKGMFFLFKPKHAEKETPP